MRHTELSLKLIALVVAMFGFGYALVPVYNVLCDVTGLNGRTDSTTPATAVERPDEDRSVRIEFVASVNRTAPFEFRPLVTSMQITPGKVYEAAFFARNLSQGAVVSQAVPSIAPGIAAEHLKKIQCFCFTQQAFGPGEQRNLGVTFLVDPELLDSIDTLTLSYTLFAIEN